MNSAISIDIEAPPAVVFALARDVSRWAEVLPHYRRSRMVRPLAIRDGWAPP